MFSDSEEDYYKFVRESREAALKHEWIYHCTTYSALKNMIISNEMWLSNLGEVNDKEETKRIDVPEYEKSYYVGCFTYDPIISENHWDEYSNKENEIEILVGMRQNWFGRELYFLNDSIKADTKIFKIWDNHKEAVSHMIEESNKGKRISTPTFVMDYGFYEIIYDNKLKKDMKCDWWDYRENGKKIYMGKGLVLGVPGIIKSEYGMCVREGKCSYIKNWKEEKEIRLKVGIMYNEQLYSKGIWFKKIAVKYTEKAFLEVPIKFGPGVETNKRRECLDELSELLPKSKIYEI